MSTNNLVPCPGSPRCTSFVEPGGRICAKCRRAARQANAPDSTRALFRGSTQTHIPQSASPSPFALRGWS